LLQQELLRKSEGFDSCHCDEQELSLQLVAQVVVAEAGVHLQVLSEGVTGLLQELRVQMVTDAHRPLLNKVHFEYILFLVEDHIFVLPLTEKARHQPICHIIQELAVLVLLRFEECSKVVKNVVKQKVYNNGALN